MACLARVWGHSHQQHKGKLGRLVLIDIPWWYDVGVAKRALGVGEACISCQGPRRRSDVEVFSEGVGGFRRSGVGVSSCTTSRRRRDRFDRRVGKTCSSCRGPSTSGGVGSFRRGDAGVSCKSSRRRRDRCDRRVGKAYSSRRGLRSSGVVGSSKSCIGEASDWGA